MENVRATNMSSSLSKAIAAIEMIKYLNQKWVIIFVMHL